MSGRVVLTSKLHQVLSELPGDVLETNGIPYFATEGPAIEAFMDHEEYLFVPEGSCVRVNGEPCHILPLLKPITIPIRVRAGIPELKRKCA